MTVPVVLDRPVWPESEKPPTRIYIAGHTYQITAPRVPLPPLAGLARVILNWAAPSIGALAKNIMYAFLPSGADPSLPATLQTIANGVRSAVNTSGLPGSVSSIWNLNGVTAKDASGTSENFANSTGAAIPGGATGGTNPPQCAVVISWTITASYRGGKPRTYLPGVPTSALFNPGSSQLNASYATGLDTAATSFLTACNAITVGPGPMVLGTTSYHSGHAVRPTPIFRPFVDVHVHERLDSQRRRSGKESAFPETP